MAEQTWCTLCTGNYRPNPRGRPSERPEWADIIQTWIPAVGDDWISKDELAEVSGLTPQQVGSAISFLRDTEPDLPLVSGPEGYRFSIDEEDINRYRKAAVKTAHTRIRRAWRGVILPYLKHGDTSDYKRRQITKAFDRLLEDISDLVD